MSDFNGQKCDVCGAVNTTAATNWVRLFGVTLGGGLQAIQNVTPPTPGQPRQFTPPPKLDFCPACAPKTSVDQLPKLLVKTQIAAAAARQAAIQSALKATASNGASAPASSK